AAEMLNQARRIALGLYSLGVRKGDRVAIFSESRFEWVLTDQGCIFAGAIGVPIYPTLTPPQVAYILKDSGARALFTSDPTKVSEIASVVESCPTIEHVIVFEADDLAEPRLLTLSQVQARGDEVEKQKPRLFAELAAASQPDDLATIIYTS